MSLLLGHFAYYKRSLFCEANSLVELRVIVEDRVNNWNNLREHSSLGNQMPMNMLKRGSKMRTNKSRPRRRSFVGIGKITETHKTPSAGTTFRVNHLQVLIIGVN